MIQKNGYGVRNFHSTREYINEMYYHGTTLANFLHIIAYNHQNFISIMIGSPEDIEAQTTLPMWAFGKVDVIEDIKMKPHQTLMDEVCTEKEQTEHQSETQSMEKVISKHINSKEMMTKERSTKSDYETKELEKISESRSNENLKIKNSDSIIILNGSEGMEGAIDV